MDLRGGDPGMAEPTTFGERLRRLRETAGLSQEALARAAGLSTSTIAKVEQRGIDPSWTTVQALATALGVSSEAFRSGVADEPAGPRPADAPAGGQAGPSGEKPAKRRPGKGRAKKGPGGASGN